MTGSPQIADFRCWTWPEVVILGADQKERGLWGREWTLARNNAHGNLAPEAEKREPENEVE